MNDYPYLDEPQSNLEHEVSIENKVYKVSLLPYDYEKRGYWINTEAPNIWIIIHGLNNSPESERIKHFANGFDEIIRSKQGEQIEDVNTEELDGVSPDDQLLMLDWSTAAKPNDLPLYPLIGWIPVIKDIPLDYAAVASRVEDVGKAVSEIVREAGLDPKRINIISHSLGCYVAAYAAKSLGVVNTITLLDSAATYDPQSLYNDPIEILEKAPSFDKVSNYSIHYGSTTKLGTHNTSSHESYWVDIVGIDVNSEHGEILRWFIDNARRPIDNELSKPAFDATKFNFLASEPQYPIIGLDENSAPVGGWEGTFWATSREDHWFTSAPEIYSGRQKRPTFLKMLHKKLFSKHDNLDF